MSELCQQWEAPLYTDKLHESARAYDTFKCWCHNPMWSLHELAVNTGVPYGTVKNWSSKYYFVSRKREYIRHLQEELEELLLVLNKKALDGVLGREDVEQELLATDLQIVRHLQVVLLEQVESGDMLNPADVDLYCKLRSSYCTGKRGHVEMLSDYVDMVEVCDNIGATGEDEGGLSYPARLFVEAIGLKREEVLPAVELR